MSQKKSILFVAEKQAALDVVKNRLDNIGLGDFCLDIHSDKIQKKKVHESLKTRIDNQPSYHFDEDEFNNTLQFLQSKQLELQHYVQEINSKWEGTDKTIQEILMSAARYQNEVNQEDFNHYPLEPINNGNLASYQISQIISSFKSYYEFSEKVKSQILELNGEKAHPWAFVNNSDLTNKDEATIKMKLEELIATIESIEQLIEKINTSYIDELDFGNTPEQIKNIVLPITNIKIPHEIVQLRLINELNESTQVKLNESYSACQKILASKDQLIQLVNHNSLANLENLIEDIQQIQYIQEFGIDKKTTTYELLGSLETISLLYKSIDNLQSSRLDLLQVLSPKVQDFFDMSEAGIERLSQFLKIIDELCSFRLKVGLLKQLDLI